MQRSRVSCRSRGYETLASSASSPATMPLPVCDCSADSACDQTNSSVIAWQLHGRNTQKPDWGKACYRSKLNISLQTRLHVASLPGYARCSLGLHGLTRQAWCKACEACTMCSAIKRLSCVSLCNSRKDLKMPTRQCLLLANHERTTAHL